MADGRLSLARRALWGLMRWGYAICERRAHMVLQAGLRAHASFPAGLENIYTFVIVFASVCGLREGEGLVPRTERTVRHLARSSSAVDCSCALCCLFRPALGARRSTMSGCRSLAGRSFLRSITESLGVRCFPLFCYSY